MVSRYKTLLVFRFFAERGQITERREIDKKEKSEFEQVI